MLHHLPIVFLASLHPIAVADALPKFDIGKECRAETDTRIAEQRCEADEQQARDELQKEWGQFAAHDVAECNKETEVASPSYVELLTCLEMSRDVKKEESNGGAAAK
jgi:hypothetical protein